MKVECNGNDLSEAVAKVIKAVPARSTNPILEGIKLTAEDGTLTLTATDLELSIEHMIRANVIESGDTVVPGKLFADFVKKLTSQNIVLTATGSRLKIDYERSEGEFGCYSADQYPEINRIDILEGYAPNDPIIKRAGELLLSALWEAEEHYISSERSA